MKKLTLTQGKLMVWDMPKMPDINDYDEDCGYGYDCDRRINVATAEGVEVDLFSLHHHFSIRYSETLTTFHLTFISGEPAIEMKEDDIIDLPDGLGVEKIYQVYVTTDPIGWYGCTEESYEMNRANGAQVKILARIIQKPMEKKQTCPKCLTKDFASCHSMHCPVRKEPVNEAPDNSGSQEDIVREILDSYDDWIWNNSGDNGPFSQFMKSQLEKFTITRRKP